jgi:hypothetical protein
MSDDFGHMNLISEPFLERIVRGERLSEDQQRRQRYFRPKPIKKDPSDTPADDIEKTDDSTSSQHIDLRI